VMTNGDTTLVIASVVTILDDDQRTDRFLSCNGTEILSCHSALTGSCWLERPDSHIIPQPFALSVCAVFSRLFSACLARVAEFFLPEHHFLLLQLERSAKTVP